MLKNNNYLDKRTGHTLPVVALAQVNTELGKATFHIGISREAILKGKDNIIETRTMFLTFDRNVNPYEYAYAKAKEQKRVLNDETQEYELVDGIFTGWEDER